MQATPAAKVAVAPLAPELRLWQNAGWNLCGITLPMAVGAFVIPRLIERMGASRFGLLTVAWTLVGYLSLFDFGIGRSLTKLVAEKIGSGDTEAVPRLWSGSMALLLAQGIAGGLLLAALAPWLTGSVLKIPQELRGEAQAALWCVALIVPVVTSSAGLRGFLEAHCAFRSLNVVKVGLGVLGFAGPLVALQWSERVTAGVLTLLGARLVAWAGYFVLCRRIGKTELRFRIPPPGELAALFRLGGWMTVSNVVSPMMTSLDSFLIGALISVSQIQYYSVPAEAVNKGLLLPASLAAVLFPVFSTLLVSDRRRAERIYSRSIGYLTLFLAPFVVGCILLAKPALTVWLGGEFASRSYVVAQVIAIGVFMNGIASVPFALLQASGRPDVTAKLHLLELPIYALAVVVLTMQWGVVGTALAWTGRVTLDSILLLLCSPVRLRIGARA